MFRKTCCFIWIFPPVDECR